MGGRAAHGWAENATALRGQYAADCEPIAVAVAATADRLQRRRRSPSRRRGA